MALTLSLCENKGANIGSTGITSLSESLKKNTALAKLYLRSKCKKTKTIIRKQITKTTGNGIGDIGATSLSEALKLNSALTELDIGCTCNKQKKRE